MEPGPIERSGYKQTLLHNFSAREGLKIKDGPHALDDVIHMDSELCPCGPTPMIWAPVEIWSPEMNRNMVVNRWVDKRTYKEPAKAHMNWKDK